MVDLRKLLAASEENLPAIIRKLKGQAPEVEQALVQKAPVIEGEVVGDLVPQAEKRILPDIEGTLAQKTPSLITQGLEEATPQTQNYAAGIADEVINQATKKGPTATQQIAGLAGLGAAAYGANKLMSGDQKPPKDTTNFVDDGEEGQDPDYDENDSIQNPTNNKPFDAKSASDYLALSKQQPSPEIPYRPDEVSAPKEDDFTKKLMGAQEQDRSNSLLFGLLKAAQQGGSAAASSKADTSYADAQLAKPNQAVNQLKTQTDLLEENKNIQDKNQKRDPNSRISKIYQSMLQQLKPDMDVKGLSATDVEKVFPQIGTIVTKQEALEAKKAQQEVLRQQKEDKVKQKLDSEDANRIEKLNKNLIAEVASGKSAFGTAAKNLQAISNAKTLLEGSKNLDDIDNRQMAEIARVLDRVLSGGTPTISGTEHLTPQTARMKIAQFMEKYTNTVQGAHAAEFVEKFQHTFDREEQQAKKQIRSTQNKFLGGVSDIAQRNPEKLEAMLEAHGIKGSFDKRGVFIPENMEEEKPQSEKSTTISGSPNKGFITQQTLNDYAAKHKIDLKTAADLLSKAGYGIK